MDVQRCEGAGAFLDATLAYREAEPLRTNVLGSVAAAVVGGAVRYPETFWWAVRGADGCVVGAAIRTAPFALSLGPMEPAAAGALATAVAADDDDFPSVAGFGATHDAFLAAYAATGTPGARRVAAGLQRQVLYTAASVAVPDVEGVPRVASVVEVDLAQQWYLDFTEEVDGVRLSSTEDDRATLLETLGAGRLRWWWHDDEAVSMAAHAVPVATPGGVVTRIGPVFTPPSKRGHGYAAALTGRLTEVLLAGGSRVMLYADAANATSNGVYQRLGFTRVDELVRTSLATTHR